MGVHSDIDCVFDVCHDQPLKPFMATRVRAMGRESFRPVAVGHFGTGTVVAAGGDGCQSQRQRSILNE